MSKKNEGDEEKVDVEEKVLAIVMLIVILILVGPPIVVCFKRMFW